MLFSLIYLLQEKAILKKLINVNKYNLEVLSVAAIDIFIGETEFVNRGVGSSAISLFLEQHVFKQFDYVFVDPDAKNLAAIKCYQKAGFDIIKEEQVIWMLKGKYPVRLSFTTLESIKELFRKHFLSNDKLWIFGSRANLKKRGGDIDLYIETDMDNLDKVFANKMQFICELQEKIGEQRIDVVINSKAINDNLPIYTVAKQEGVKIL